MTALELVKLLPLMERTAGHAGAASSVPALTSSVSRPEGKAVTFGGTSVAAPFVTGGVALLWSEFPIAPATEPRGNNTTAAGRVVGFTSSCSAEDIQKTVN